jgi:hypothetical protein
LRAIVRRTGGDGSGRWDEPRRCQQRPTSPDRPSVIRYVPFAL